MTREQKNTNTRKATRKRKVVILKSKIHRIKKPLNNKERLKNEEKYDEKQNIDKEYEKQVLSEFIYASEIAEQQENISDAKKALRPFYRDLLKKGVSVVVVNTVKRLIKDLLKKIYPDDWDSD